MGKGGRLGGAGGGIQGKSMREVLAQVGVEAPAGQRGPGGERG